MLQQILGLFIPKKCSKVRLSPYLESYLHMCNVHGKIILGGVTDF